MTTSRAELREDLVAVIQAAPELPRDGREHLADVFLDRLSAEYDLVPRGARVAPRPARPTGAWRDMPLWAKIAAVFAFLLVAAALVVHHVPILLLAVVVVFFMVRRARARRSSPATFV